jgi:ABC-type sulfate transport system permease component
MITIIISILVSLMILPHLGTIIKIMTLGSVLSAILIGTVIAIFYTPKGLIIGLVIGYLLTETKIFKRK